MIVLRALRNVFQQGDSEVPALAGVTLDVAAGEFVSVVVPSGSGKSTLLHLIGGLDQPTAGEVSIEGTPISHMTDDGITIFRGHRIGFVFQFFNLLPTLTAEENVALPLALDRRRPRDIRPRVEAALEQVQISTSIGPFARSVSCLPARLPSRDRGLSATPGRAAPGPRAAARPRRGAPRRAPCARRTPETGRVYGAGVASSAAMTAAFSRVPARRTASARSFIVS